MGRIMAIDYGQKRCGVAVTDTLQIIASGLTTVPAQQAVSFIVDYIKNEPVDLIVVGEPKDMHNNPSDSTRFIEPFVKQLKKTLPDMKVVRFDERFTSKMAFQTMIDSGLKKKQRQNKALVDEISATIILQSYMKSIDIMKEKNI